MDIFHALLEGMSRTDIMVEGTAAVQIMVNTVKTGIFKHLCLLFRQKSDGAAKVCSVFFHFADAAGQFFNFLISKFHTA